MTITLHQFSPNNVVALHNSIPGGYSILNLGSDDCTLSYLALSPSFYLGPCLDDNGNTIIINGCYVNSMNKKISGGSMAINTWNHNESNFGIIFDSAHRIYNMGHDYKINKINKGKTDITDLGPRSGKNYIFLADWFNFIVPATEKEIRAEFGSSGLGTRQTMPSVNPTNTCIKCGYNNEFIDPVPGYVCSQCRIRDERWK